jgi:hypothetical protein
MEKDKSADPGPGSANASYAIAVMMGLAGLATAGLIVYEMARAFFRFAFGVELPNPFP